MKSNEKIVWFPRGVPHRDGVKLQLPDLIKDQNRFEIGGGRELEGGTIKKIVPKDC